MANPTKKRKYHVSTEVVRDVDPTTGEVLDLKVKRNSVELHVSNDEFFFTYSSILKVTAGTTPIEGLLLQAMCFASDFNKGVVHISPALRGKWCEDFKCTKQSLSNALQGLKKKGLIFDMIQGQRGSFLINPTYMFKGDQKSRSEAYELMLKITTKVDSETTVKKGGDNV